MLGFGLYRAAGAIKLVCRKFSDQLGRVKITLLITITAASEVIALWCMLNLWRNRILDPENALDVDPPQSNYWASVLWRNV